MSPNRKIGKVWLNLRNRESNLLLGSTGSIGTQTLDIVAHNPDQFRIVGLAAGSNVEMLAQQIRQFRPEIVAICETAKLLELREAIADLTPSQPF